MERRASDLGLQVHHERDECSEDGRSNQPYTRPQQIKKMAPLLGPLVKEARWKG